MDVSPVVGISMELSSTRGRIPGPSLQLAPQASRMFPVRAADIAPRDSALPRSRSASADCRAAGTSADCRGAGTSGDCRGAGTSGDCRGAGTLARHSGFRSYALGTEKLHSATHLPPHLPPHLPHKTPHIWEFHPKSSTSSSTEKSSSLVSPIKLKLSFARTSQKVESTLSVDSSSFRLSESNQNNIETGTRFLAPRAPAGQRRVSSASQLLLKSKLLAQREDLATKPAFVTHKFDSSAADDQGPSKQDSKPITRPGLCLEPQLERMMAPNPPKLFSPISAWREPRSKSAVAPKRTCFREDVDIIYFDTEEKPTEAQDRDSEKLKDEIEEAEEEEDDIEKGNDENEAPISAAPPPSSPEVSSAYSMPYSPTQPATSTPTKHYMTKPMLAKNVCLKQEIRLLPNSEDARQNLIRRDSCRLSVIVLIDESCIKQMTSVKAMSGGRSLVVVTHRPCEGRSLMAGHTHPASGELAGWGPASMQDGAMVLIQHVDRMRLPVEINPYAVKAHIHKDWTLRIEAPVRDWLDCPSTVLRCRLPLGTNTELGPKVGHLRQGVL